MREFVETREMFSCETVVNYDGEKAILCGRPTHFRLVGYKKPYAMCVRHINRNRGRAEKIRKITNVFLPD